MENFIKKIYDICFWIWSLLKYAYWWITYGIHHVPRKPLEHIVKDIDRWWRRNVQSMTFTQKFLPWLNRINSALISPLSKKLLDWISSDQSSRVFKWFMWWKLWFTKVFIYGQFKAGLLALISNFPGVFFVIAMHFFGKRVLAALYSYLTIEPHWKTYVFIFFWFQMINKYCFELNPLHVVIHSIMYLMIYLKIQPRRAAAVYKKSKRDPNVRINLDEYERAFYGLVILSGPFYFEAIMEWLAS